MTFVKTDRNKKCNQSSLRCFVNYEDYGYKGVSGNLIFYFFFHVQLIRTECEFEAAFIRVDSLKLVECFIL